MTSAETPPGVADLLSQLSDVADLLSQLDVPLTEDELAARLGGIVSSEQAAMVVQMCPHCFDRLHDEIEQALQGTSLNDRLTFPPPQPNLQQARRVEAENHAAAVREAAMAHAELLRREADSYRDAALSTAAQIQVDARREAERIVERATEQADHIVETARSRVGDYFEPSLAVQGARRSRRLAVGLAASHATFGVRPERAAAARDKLFISYSHKDAKTLSLIRPYLANLSTDIWDDTRLRPGDRWAEEIVAALSGAKLALLLISQEFLASEFIVRHELPAIFAAAEKGARILGLIVDPVHMGPFPALSAVQMVNPQDRPLSRMSRDQRGQTLVDLARTIHEELA